MSASDFGMSFPDGPKYRLRIKETRARVKDLKPGFRKAEPKVHRAVDRWFQSEGEGGWAPLALSTIEARANRWGYYKHGFREGPMHKILHARHHLRKSLTSSGGKNLSRLTKRTWSFGSSFDKAGYLHRGASVGLSARPMPPRSLVPKRKLPKLVGEELKEHILLYWRQSYGSA